MPTTDKVQLQTRLEAPSAQSKSSGGYPASIDAGPQAPLQRRLQALADNSPRSLQFKALADVTRPKPALQLRGAPVDTGAPIQLMKHSAKNKAILESLQDKYPADEHLIKIFYDECTLIDTFVSVVDSPAVWAEEKIRMGKAPTEETKRALGAAEEVKVDLAKKAKALEAAKAKKEALAPKKETKKAQEEAKIDAGMGENKTKAKIAPPVTNKLADLTKKVYEGFPLEYAQSIKACGGKATRCRAAAQSKEGSHPATVEAKLKLGKLHSVVVHYHPHLGDGADESSCHLKLNASATDRVKVSAGQLKLLGLKTFAEVKEYKWYKDKHGNWQF